MDIALLVVSIVMFTLMAIDIKNDQFKNKKKVITLAALLLILAVIKGGLL